MSIEDNIEAVIDWASDKGIYFESTSFLQAEKTGEEYLELVSALYRLYTLDDRESYLEDEIRIEVKDAIGDIIVTLINVAYLEGLTLEECLKHSLGVIQDRKGEMIDGKFVKEE